MSRAYESAQCPMPGCTMPLHISVSAGRPVHTDDTAEEIGFDKLSDAYTATWTIGCEDGHVVLLPQFHGDDYEQFGEPCKYTEGDDPCGHDDLARLRGLLYRMGSAPVGKQASR